MTVSLSAAITAFKNIQFTTSILAGGAASVLFYTVGAILVGLNVTIPLIGVPLTLAIVAPVSIGLGHLVTALVPDSTKQSIAGLAAKLPSLQAMIPDIDSSPSAFPNAPPSTLTQSNINKASAAVAVIQAHVVGFPDGKNGA